MSIADLENRIHRVTSDLREETAIPGQYGLASSVLQRMAQTCTPALSVAVVDNLEVAWARGFGKLNVNHQPVEASTPFQSGSISKPVFALAVMKLSETGIVDLDADVNTYLKSWRLTGKDGWQPRVTLRQLLSHSAGTTVHGFPGYPPSGPLPTIPQVLDGVPPVNTQAVLVDVLPGTQFRYSGGGTTIAQQVIVDVTGTPLPELVRELILDPVGMENSCYEQPPPAVFAQRTASGYPINGIEVPGGYHVYPEMAAAGLWTTAGDLALLGSEMMRALRGDASRLALTPETVSSMLRPQLRNQEIGQEFVGLGWFCAGREQTFRFFHNGGNHGYLATMLMLPTIGKGAVVMLNSNQGWMLLSEAMAAIGREYSWPTLEDIPVINDVLPDVAYDGSYQGASGKIAVARDGNRLLVEFAGQMPLAVYPSAAGDFVATAINLRLQFADSDKAPPSELTVVTGNMTESFKRTD
jgi:CubicO group peptidase (beta-lactamase class C family)